jgi:hypothetical protein
VTKTVVEDGVALNLSGTEEKGEGGAMEWIDHPELKFGPGESVSKRQRILSRVLVYRIDEI